MSKTAEQILAEAADLVEFSGRWGQARNPGQILPRGVICAGLAIEEVAADIPLANKVVRVFALEVGRDYTAWNDTPGRTKEEVAATLRNAKRHLAA